MCLLWRQLATGNKGQESSRPTLHPHGTLTHQEVIFPKKVCDDPIKYFMGSTSRFGELRQAEEEHNGKIEENRKIKEDNICIKKHDLGVKETVL